MQWLQLFYVHSQLWVTGYNAIYGSFAALPLFMLWVQISWTICLFGAEMTYTNQHMKRMGINIQQPDFHPYVEMGDDERSDEAINYYADGIDGL
jgi:membrane protein